METLNLDWIAGAESWPMGKRDRCMEMARLIGRYGVMTVEQVMAATGVGRTVTYRRAALLIEAGLLERVALLCSQPPLLRATREGLRYAGLEMPVARVSPGTADHQLRCTAAALRASRDHAPACVLSERDILLAEAVEGRQLASVEVGTSPGRPRMHRADLAVAHADGIVAIEVELTAKAPRRLDGLMRGWRRAIARGLVREVHYLCEPGQPRRAVERAARRVSFESGIVIADAPPRHG